jgi:pimeloyl-ACP methyl ester carboxylesterase
MHRTRNDTILHANGVPLCVETFGAADDAAILLIMGAAASMDWWEDEFCERLAAGGRFVIRYDHRDTGRSVTYEPGAPGYTGPDLVEDTVGVLDALGLSRAHLVGMSMGGALAQLAALDHPDRVTSLTLIATSPAGPHEADLPGMTDEAIATFQALTEPDDWTDRRAVVDYLTDQARACASPSRPFDEQAARELSERVVDRTVNIASTAKNHHLAEGGGRWRERLGELDVPTLVIHGTEDPVMPYGHGLALAREIAGARLLALDHTGHELPRPVWDVVVPAILEHTAGR